MHVTAGKISPFLRETTDAPVLLAFVLIGTALFPSMLDSESVFRGLLVTLSAGVVCMYAGYRIYRDTLTLPLSVSLCTLFFGLLIAMSALFSKASWSSFVGTSFAQGSAASLLALLGTLFLSALLIRSNTSRTWVAATVAVLGGALSVLWLADAFIAPLWGKEGQLFWNIASREFMIGAGLISATFFLNSAPVSSIVRNVLFASAFFSFAYLLLLGTQGGLVLISMSSLTFAVCAYFMQRISKKFLWLALAAAILLFLRLLFWESAATSMLATEFRLSYPPSARILAASLSESPHSFILGMGPSHFSAAWESYRPLSFNSSPLSDETFDVGFSTALTRAVELGGVFIFAALLAVCLFIWKSVRTLLEKKEEDISSDLLFLVLVLYCLSWFLFTIPNVFAELVFVVLVGAALGGLFPQRHGEKEAGATRFVHRILPPLMFSAIGLTFVGLSTLFFAAHMTYERGVLLYGKGDMEGSISLLEKASTLVPTPLFAKALAEAYQAKLDAALDSKAPVEEITGLLERSHASAIRARDLDPLSYEVWITFGNIQAKRAVAGGISTADAAGTYEVARRLSPYRPLAHFLLAQLYYFQGEERTALAYARQALELKPDFTDAQELAALLLEKNGIYPPR